MAAKKTSRKKTARKKRTAKATRSTKKSAPGKKTRSVRKRATTKQSGAKKTSRARKSASVISALKYKGRTVEVVKGRVTPALEVDGRAVPVKRDADTGFYSTPGAPYLRFATLEEAGKGVVDSESD